MLQASPPQLFFFAARRQRSYWPAPTRRLPAGPPRQLLASEQQQAAASSSKQEAASAVSRRRGRNSRPADGRRWPGSSRIGLCHPRPSSGLHPQTILSSASPFPRLRASPARLSSWPAWQLPKPSSSPPRPAAAWPDGRHQADCQLAPAASSPTKSGLFGLASLLPSSIRAPTLPLRCLPSFLHWAPLPRTRARCFRPPRRFLPSPPPPHKGPRRPPSVSTSTSSTFASSLFIANLSLSLSFAPSPSLMDPRQQAARRATTAPRTLVSLETAL